MATENTAAQDAKARAEADKKRLSEEREARVKANEEREKKKGTPTPTQEECDMLKLGHPVELANDGSGPDPNMPQQTRDMQAEHRGGYETRQSRPAAHQSATKP
jgi:hypothetical protein